MFIRSAVTAVRPLVQSPSVAPFGALAASRTTPLFDTVSSTASRIKPSSLPHDADLRVLRKDMQKLRDHLDLFAFAYGGKGQAKTWKSLRGALNEGYEKLGHYKDLFDSQGVALTPGTSPTYDMVELGKRHKRVLTWVKEFSDPTKQREWRRLITTPSKNIETIDKDELSKFFWGRVSVRPKSKDTGLVSVGRLAKALSQDSAQNIKDTRRLGPLTRQRDEVQFHDTRKHLRSTSNLLKNFPELSGPAAKKLLATVDEALIKYGDIGDKLVGYHLAQASGRGARATMLEEEIRVAWKQLRDWQDRVELPKVAQQLGDTVVFG